MTQRSGTHREFYEREFRGYVKLSGPVGYGAVQARRPLQSTRARIVQEWPGYHPTPWVTPAFIPAPPITTFVGQPQARVTQEWPGYHPAATITGPFLSGATLPLQANAAKVSQEWPWHPLPWASAPFPVSAIQQLQAIKARLEQEWPAHHPAPKVTGPFPVSAVRPLQSARMQVTQEWPAYHPTPAARGPFFPHITFPSFPVWRKRPSNGLGIIRRRSCRAVTIFGRSFQPRSAPYGGLPIAAVLVGRHRRPSERDRTQLTRPVYGRCTSWFPGAQRAKQLRSCVMGHPGAEPSYSRPISILRRTVGTF